jgi:hypothetical protein
VIWKDDFIPDLPGGGRIYESVLRSSRHPNNYVRGEPEWECLIGNNSLSVRGFIYAQQNQITNVCAHVAIKTVLGRFGTEADISYHEMNQVIGVDHRVKRVGHGGGGLQVREMVKILDAFGIHCVAIDYGRPASEYEVAPFQKVLYGSIESGYPAIVVFQTAEHSGVCHAIPIVGHTFNEDTWVYRAESSYFRVGAGTRYIPSESWLSMYIAHDDNWGSNFCIPRRYLHTRRHCQLTDDADHRCVLDVGCVVHVIGTLPRGVKMNALQAEVIGADYLFAMLRELPDTSERWRRRLSDYADQSRLVLRPVLVTGKEYSQHLSAVTDWSYRKLGFELQFAAESYFWMVELSVPELFSANRRKVGEVVLRAEMVPTSARDLKSLFFAPVPGFFVFHVRGGSSRPPYEFVPCPLQSHVELYGCEESR